MKFPDKVDEYTRLLPVEEAGRAMKHAEDRIGEARCPKYKAKQYALKLAENYAAGPNKSDTTAQINGIAKVFTHYSEYVVQKALDIMNGLPSKHDYLPTVKQTIAECKLVVGNGIKIWWSAKQNIKETQRRKEEAEAERRAAHTPEQRAANIKLWEDAKKEIANGLSLQKTIELEGAIARDEAAGRKLSQYRTEQLASSKRKRAMLERDPRTLLSAADLITPPSPPSEELKAKAREPLNKTGERWL